MTILIVANYNAGRGGISGVIENHVERLTHEGQQVKIFNTKTSFLRRLFLFYSLIPKLKNVNIVHAHGCSFWGFLPIFLSIVVCKIIKNKRLIVTYHGGGADVYLKKNSWWIRYFLHKADHVTVMSEYLKNIFTKYHIPTVILPNLINVKIYENRIDDFSVPRLVSVRSHEPVYNIQDIIKAFALIKKQYVHARLDILGNGSLHQNLQNMVLNLQLPDVQFCGAMKTQEVPAFLRKSNIFVSVSSYDNQPMSILEAFASGIPVIASHVGGIPCMIKDGITGFLVDVNEPEQIASRVNWIINHPQEVKQITENAQKELYFYQWEHIRKILYQLYSN